MLLYLYQSIFNILKGKPNTKKLFSYLRFSQSHDFVQEHLYLLTLFTWLELYLYKPLECVSRVVSKQILIVNTRFTACH